MMRRGSDDNDLLWTCNLPRYCGTVLCCCIFFFFRRESIAVFICGGVWFEADGRMAGGIRLGWMDIQIPPPHFSLPPYMQRRWQKT